MFIHLQETQRHWQDAVLAMPPLLGLVTLALGISGVMGVVAICLEISIPNLLFLLLGLLAMINGKALIQRKTWSRISITIWFFLLHLMSFFSSQPPENIPPSLWQAIFALNLVFTLFIIVYLFRSKGVAAYFYDA